jgi:hypothetical protein
MVKKSADSLDFKTYVWAQSHNDLIRHKLKNRYSLDDVESESDEFSDNDEPKNNYDLDLDIPGKSTKEIQQIEIIQDACDFIYYVVCQNEEIKVMEINPRDNG